MVSPWKLLHCNPPALVRLSARRRIHQKTVKAMSLEEIAISSGLPLARVQTISQSLTWDGITVPEAERFVAGCNFDPLKSADRNRQSAYRRSCKNQPFKFLKSSPWWETEFRPLIQALKTRRLTAKKAS